MNMKTMKLATLLFVGIGSWGLTHVDHGHVEWSTFGDPLHVFGLLGIVGSILAGWQDGRKMGDGDV